MNKYNKIITYRGREYYRIKICNSQRDLPLFEATQGVKIAIFNLLGETQLVHKIALALAKKLPKNAQVIITPEVKSISLAYELATVMKLPYIVVRKIHKPYMVGSISTDVITMTTGKLQTIYLDGKDLKLIKGKKVIVVDDVISTGGTLEGLRQLMKKSGSKIIAESAVFTEGDPKKWKNIISLGNLPVITDQNEK